MGQPLDRYLHLQSQLKDPAVLFTNGYTSVIYGISYSSFEVFPLAYSPKYGFNLSLTGTTIFCIINGHCLVPALFAIFFPTIGLFIFAWTARPSIHWIVSAISIVIYGASGFILFQCVFAYIPLSYPQYAASLFAGNEFLRSSFALGSVLFSRAMYLDLGIAKGVLKCSGNYYLYFHGAKLRARSKLRKKNPLSSLPFFA
ncbi:hypothetical protein V8E54_009869 [Elaphomyces granulatus]